MDKCTGIILAGGKSSRMGRDKVLLPWRGARLVDYVAGVLREAGITDIHVSGEVEGYSGIPDMLMHQGPVAAIASVVLSSQMQRNEAENTFLFVPVDMPFLEASLLEKLLCASGDGDAVCFEARPLPLLLRVNPEVKRILESAVEAMKRGNSFPVKLLLRAFNRAEVDSPLLAAYCHPSARWDPEHRVRDAGSVLSCAADAALLDTSFRWYDNNTPSLGAGWFKTRELVVTAEAEQALRNTNTPSEWEEAARESAHQ